MRPNFFRAYGLLALLLSPLASVDVIGYSVNEAPSEIAWLRASFLTSFAVLVGVGLLLLRKWAAIYFSLPLFCLGVWKFLAVIPAVTFPYNLLLMVHALSLTIPLFITIRVWNQLTWGRRFF